MPDVLESAAWYIVLSRAYTLIVFVLHARSICNRLSCSMETLCSFRLTPIFLNRGLNIRSFLSASICRLRWMDAARFRSSLVAVWNFSIVPNSIYVRTSVTRARVSASHESRKNHVEFVTMERLSDKHGVTLSKSNAFFVSKQSMRDSYLSIKKKLGQFYFYLHKSVDNVGLLLINRKHVIILYKAWY